MENMTYFIVAVERGGTLFSYQRVVLASSYMELTYSYEYQESDKIFYTLSTCQVN